MKLVVISHTDHYYDANGTVVGWGPTVREIDAIAGLFDEVVHIACIYKNTPAPASAKPYGNHKVRFAGIPPFGGNGFKSKWNIISTALPNLSIIRRELKDADVFHFRAPTSIGLYVIPYLSLSRKKGWYKYAGNWVSKNAALSYRLQRWMLLNMQSKRITINGQWPNQPAKCISFENPCLYASDRVEGEELLKHKEYTRPYRLCFVGRLDKEKGVYSILEALKGHPDKLMFDSLEIVGDGPEKAKLESEAKNMGVKIIMHGALNREQLFEVYKRSHFILLPSESEGFPKVVAEAANFGCIPIVSNVSAISQYVNSSNGFLWDANENSFTNFFTTIDFEDAHKIKLMSIEAYNMASRFTYEYYIMQLKQYILS